MWTPLVDLGAQARADKGYRAGEELVLSAYIEPACCHLSLWASVFVTVASSHSQVSSGVAEL